MTVRISEGQLRRIVKEELKSEMRVRMSHDPDDLGAYIDDDTGVEELPVVDLPVSRIEGFEPDSKMDVPKHHRRMTRMVRTLQDRGPESLPPILVRRHPSSPGRWQIIDGHHRFHAHRLAGSRRIPARVVPDEDIEDTGHDYYLD